MGLIRVHHLSDGLPVKAANIEIYQSKLAEKSRPQPVPCATGKTDDNGILVLEDNQLTQCYPQMKSSLPQLLVIASENQDWAFARTEEYSGAYGYGIDAGWKSEKPESRGIIFSDRQLYQPGEKAAFTAFANYLEKGKIQEDKNAVYQVTLVNPNGQNTDLGTKTTNEFSTFSLELPITKNQPLGFYTDRGDKKEKKLM